MNVKLLCFMQLCQSCSVVPISTFYYRVPYHQLLSPVYLGYTSCWISLLWYHQYYWEPYSISICFGGELGCPEMVSLVDMPLCKFLIPQHQAVETHLVTEVFCSCSHQPWLIFSSFLLSLSTPTLVLYPEHTSLILALSPLNSSIVDFNRSISTAILLFCSDNAFMAISNFVMRIRIQSVVSLRLA